MNSTLANRSIIKPSPIVITANVPNQIENTVIAGVLTGVTTFGGLFGAWTLLYRRRDRQTRPDLQIDQKDNPHVQNTTIGLPFYDIPKPELPEDNIGISKFDSHYRVNRIKVKNEGNSAAEECKGIIIQKGIEMKVCWDVPSERHKMTINAKSHEFLDACGVLIDDPEKSAETLKNNVNALPPDYKNRRGETTIVEQVPTLRSEYLTPFKDDQDNHKLIEKHFPNIIAPTENKWQHPPNLNWILEPGEGSIRITCKNAAPIEYRIQILNNPEEGKIIKVGEKLNIRHSFLKTKSLVMKD